MNKISLLITGLLAATAVTGCQETCERTSRAMNDLGTAKTLLSRGLSQAEEWPQVCNTLVMSSDAFRDDADFIRSVAADRYDSVPPGCIDVRYVQYCQGGWVRSPYYPYSTTSLTFTDISSAESDESEDLELASFDTEQVDRRVVPGRRPQPRPRPYPRPHPRPQPRPPHRTYPPHYPSHPSWGWRYVPRTCRVVPVCYAYDRGHSRRPEYNQVMTLAYEFDQAAGGIESVCKKAYDGDTREAINEVAQETLTRIDQNAQPQTQAVYNGLGCSADRRGD